MCRNGSIGRKSKFHLKMEYKNCGDNHVHIQKRHSKFDNSKYIMTFPLKTNQVVRINRIRLMFD